MNSREDIEREAEEYFQKEMLCKHATKETAMNAYLAGTNSPAKLEWVVRRAVELDRASAGVNFHEDVTFDLSPDEILAVIKKEVSDE